MQRQTLGLDELLSEFVFSEKSLVPFAPSQIICMKILQMVEREKLE